MLEKGGRDVPDRFSCIIAAAAQAHDILFSEMSRNSHSLVVAARRGLQANIINQQLKDRFVRLARAADALRHNITIGAQTLLEDFQASLRGTICYNIGDAQEGSNLVEATSEASKPMERVQELILRAGVTRRLRRTR